MDISSRLYLHSRQRAILLVRHYADEGEGRMARKDEVATAMHCLQAAARSLLKIREDLKMLRGSGRNPDLPLEVDDDMPPPVLRPWGDGCLPRQAAVIIRRGQRRHREAHYPQRLTDCTDESNSSLGHESDTNSTCRRLWSSMGAS